MQILGLLGRVQPVFAVESDAATRRLCQQLWHHDNVYHDCLAEEFLNRPQPDIDFFTSGPPCQPFSVQGLGRGCRDQRAAPLLATILWIAANLPVCWLLENVAGLVYEHGEFFVQILEMLASLTNKNGEAAYDVSWNVLDNLTHGGVPQGRRRVFVAGVRKDKRRRPMTWPPEAGS